MTHKISVGTSTIEFGKSRTLYTLSLLFVRQGECSSFPKLRQIRLLPPKQEGITPEKFSDAINRIVAVLYIRGTWIPTACGLWLAWKTRYTLPHTFNTVYPQPLSCNYVRVWQHPGTWGMIGCSCFTYSTTASGGLGSAGWSVNGGINDSGAW